MWENGKICTETCRHRICARLVGFLFGGHSRNLGTKRIGVVDWGPLDGAMQSVQTRHGYISCVGANDWVKFPELKKSAEKETYVR